MKRLATLLVVVAVLASFVAACAPTPQVIEKEVVVEKPVIETVVVEKEKVVEKPVVETVVVEKEVVVTATPEPEPESPTLARAQERGFLYVGNVQEPPFSYVNEEGEFAGIDADIARYIASELDVEELVSVHLAWDGLIPSLLAERTDMLACGMAVKPTRCEVVAFSNPYHITGPTALVEKGNPYDIHNFEDMAEHPDLIAGGVGGSFDVQVLREYLPEEQIRAYDDFSLLFEDMKAGRLDAAIATAPSLNDWVTGAGMEDKFELASPWEWPPGYFYPAGLVFRKEEQALADQASEILERMKEDGTLVQLAEQNGFPVEALAPLCSESDMGCAEYHCTEKE
jgi:polar amino acid transport system substrate-binding protein